MVWRVKGLLDWMLGATEQNILKLLAMSFGLLRNSSLMFRTALGDSDSSDPFYVFLILLMLLLK